jgi:hypothetical protein
MTFLERRVNLKDVREVSMQDLRFWQRWLWRTPSRKIQCHVIRWNSTEVSKQHVASMFRLKNKPKRKRAGSRWFTDYLTLRPWIWRRHVPLKLLLICNGAHDVVSQKMELSRRTATPLTGIGSVPPVVALCCTKYRQFSCCILVTWYYSRHGGNCLKPHGERI